MHKIYIDVTSFLATDFLTGIQRVVRSVVLEMAKSIPERLNFLAYSRDRSSFMLLKQDAFLAWLNGDQTGKEECYTDRFLRPEEMGAGNIFFDIDSVWNLPCKRSILLPELKKAGLRLAVNVYDIIPITEPHFGHFNTVFNFMGYIGAYLQYADLIIASAQSTLDEIYKLSDQLGLPRVEGFVSGLGADFAEEQEAVISNRIRSAVKKKYILCVGTIEPRKNHAYILDACEQVLFARGFHLIFAGRLGWNMETFEKRMRKSPYFNKQFFWLEGMDDAVIDYLYRHAFAVAFPTFNEGFGLPIVEALQRGTPVFTSDKPVLREVGGEFCEYINPKNPQSIIDAITTYDDSPEKYLAWKKRIESYTPPTWKETGERMIEALNTLIPKALAVKKDVKQMFLLTARPEDLTKTLPFVDAFMPFLEEIVICCPDQVKGEMENIYHGRLKLKILTDSQVLNGKPLPNDHQKRNFYLRCLAMRSGELDEVFIMSDDDYRPLEKIDLQQFVMGNRYRAYYFYDMSEWRVTVGNVTSYDIGQERTLEFLKKNHYPTYQYSSHMPQIIDRELYLEMLDTHTELESLGVDEWSVYFNYLQHHHPDILSSEPYLTISWPAHGSDWSLYTAPQALLFENYYEELYDRGGMFEGFSKDYYPGIEVENRDKCRIVSNNLKLWQKWRDQYQYFCRSYELEYGCTPSFCLMRKNGTLLLTVPNKLELPIHGTVRVPFYCNLTEDHFLIDVKLIDAVGNYAMVMPTKIVKPFQEHFELPIFGGVRDTKAGTYQLIVEFTVNGEKVQGILPATCL